MRLTDFTFIDESYTVPSKKVLVVGMSHSGPVQRPFVLGDSTKAVKLLGENQMSHAYNSLIRTGVSPEDIFLYRLNGKYGTVNLQDEEKNVFIKFKTVSAETENQSLNLSVQSQGLVIEKKYTIEKEDKEDEVFSERRTYIYEDYNLLSELVDDINQDASLGLVDVICSEIEDGNIENFFTELGEYYFINSDSEDAYVLNDVSSLSQHKELYWEKFVEGILGDDEEVMFLTKASKVPCENILFLDVYADIFPEVVTYGSKLAHAITEEQEIACHAIFSTSPVPPFETDVPDWYIDNGDGSYVDENGTTVYIDKYKEQKDYLSNLEIYSSSVEREENYMENCQIVIGHQEIDELKFPLSGFYSGMYLLNPFYAPSSNKEIVGLEGFKELLKKSDIANLSSNGYICIVDSIRRNAVAFKSQSFQFKNKNVIQRLNNQRLVGYVKKDVMEILSSYIGKDKKKLNVPQTTKILTEYFDQYADNDVIQSYKIDFPLFTKGNDSSIVELSISLNLYGEVSKINGGFSIEETKGEVDIWQINLD